MKIINGRLRLSASDVANFLACQHLTRLDLLHARGELRPPHVFDIGFTTLVERGEVHEQEVLDQFRADGLQIVEIDSGPGTAQVQEQAQLTADAIRGGADLIYQGVLLGGEQGVHPSGEHGVHPSGKHGVHPRGKHGMRPSGESAPGPALFGRPDFLVRADLLPAPDGEPRPGGVRYEVVDAKLARSAKARAVAQTAFYSHLLTGLQGIAPRWMHLALGNKERASFKVADYAAYERQTRRVLDEFIATGDGSNPPEDPYPEPVEHCAICRWSDFCADRRRSGDDLSLVAGITKGQRRALKIAGISTRRGFAALPDLPAVTKASQGSLQRAQLQARLQVASEDAGQPKYELLDPERDAGGIPIPNRGLLALPEPATGDLFFDIEGARYYSEDSTEFGLQYLFGIVDTADLDASGAPRYTQIWSFDRRGEKRAFEELIDFITERRARHPGLHVYHYNHYETTQVDHLTELHETRQEAVGRLMGRFATREDEVDDLFRLGVFVDLYRVVRQGVRAGVESYSIKQLEPLCGYARQVDLREATANLIEFEAALDEGTASQDSIRQQVVAGYNEDDCRATLALRDWLEDRRAELSEHLGSLPRPMVIEEAHDPEDPEVTRIRAALRAAADPDPAKRTRDEQAMALLADLLDWHRREAKPAWWRYFHVRTLSAGDLVREPDAIGGLTGGHVVDRVKRSVVRRFTFPPQDHKFSVRQTAFDPVTNRAWTVWGLDDALGTIDLKVASSYQGPLPAALVEDGPIDTQVFGHRLRDLGDRVLHEGLTGQNAAIALLMRRRPAHSRATQERLVTGQATDPDDTRADRADRMPLRGDDEDAGQAAVRLAVTLQDSYLPIQGPPGTGKTFTAAEQILQIVARGRTVGITGPSHAVICNLIGQVADAAHRRGIPAPRVGQRADSGNPHLSPCATAMAYPRLRQGLGDGGIDVAAGTAWMWAREQFAASVDTLFVDEAGQMSLANVLAVAGAARNLVLVGDPQQLAQPSQATHPPGAGVSALEHILDGHATMPAHAGLLIDRTWRMHPRLCDYTSTVFYDGKLTCVDGLDRQEILGEPAPYGAGLRVIEVPHQGNTSASPEEAERVAGLVNALVGRQWHDKNGTPLPISPGQILVVTPYNAQIRAIEEAMAEAGCPPGVRVGTVDKFQGGEAPVAIYSMATSSAGDAPRGLDFLYDLHRLNVATSRARAMAIIVASPDLVRVFCRTPRQMRLVNALCRAWEANG